MSKIEEPIPFFLILVLFRHRYHFLLSEDH